MTLVVGDCVHHRTANAYGVVAAIGTDRRAPNAIVVNWSTGNIRGRRIASHHANLQAITKDEFVVALLADL